MSDSFAQLRLLLTGPALCGLLLAGMAVDNRSFKAEGDFAEFHRRAADAVDDIPLTLGPWVGRGRELKPEELKLLQPNAYRFIDFTDTRPEAVGDPSRRVLFLVAQVRRAGLMEGHYPPNCYPAQGYSMVNGTGDSRTWEIGGRTIVGMQYFFERRSGDRVGRSCVYNFMVLPGLGVRPDMESVNASAEDYQQRYYGAAQFQLVFGGSLARATTDAKRQRDAAFAELIGPCLGVIDTLCDGANSHE
ncbi:MAG: exosortase-associated EpsI family protein [Tepidisphaeraceae bacterium]